MNLSIIFAISIASFFAIFLWFLSHLTLSPQFPATRRRLSNAINGARAKEEAHTRELVEKCLKLEADLRATESLRNDLIQLRTEVQKMKGVKQELAAQVQNLSQEATRAKSENQHIPLMKQDCGMETLQMVVTRTSNKEFYWFLIAAALPVQSNGYIRVACYSGLNQMRHDLCDGVGVDRLLNAALVIPKFEVAAYWNESSGFADVFDVDHFIEQMKDFITVVKDLPAELAMREPVWVGCSKHKGHF